MGKRTFKARKSKLDGFSEIIGVEPDAVVAMKAKVSSETVRTYRQRRGIEAGWRDETSTAATVGQVKAPAKPGKKARKSKPGKKARKRAFVGRRSRVAAYAHLLGEVPDAEIASMIGMSMQNVRAYRIRRGIEAGWRLPTKAKSIGEVVVPSKSDTSGGLTAAPQQVVRWAYRVTARVGVENREFIVLGDSLSDAAVQAESRLAKRIPRARVLEIVTLAEAL